MTADKSKAIEQASSIETPKGQVIAFRGAMKPARKTTPRIRTRRSTWARFINWILGSKP